jgi:NAD(P)-dependent dehydrogenase (short-subunit alcohol dehydrogenase family)
MVLSDRFHRGTQVVLVTGASSGIGAACAARLAADGHRVFATTRGEPPAAAGGIAWLALDVRDAASAERCVAQVIEAAGRLDVLVNNAGIGIAGAVEDTSPEDLVRQLDTNLLGPLRMIRAAAPHMRERRSGRIVQISSLAGRIGVPFQGAYSASKFALEGLSEALALELRPFGVDVVLVQPGDVRSGFGAARTWTVEARANPLYRERAAHAVGAMEQAERGGPPPERVARLVSRIVAARRPRLRYVCVTPFERSALWLQRILPARAFQAIVRTTYDSPRSVRR